MEKLPVPTYVLVQSPKKFELTIHLPIKPP